MKTPLGHNLTNELESFTIRNRVSLKKAYSKELFLQNGISYPDFCIQAFKTANLKRENAFK
jgi:hypothetical protein